jgi:hypothetical protein
MARHAEDYRWSSAEAHCGKRVDDLVAEDFPPPGIIPDWSGWLAGANSDNRVETVRKGTASCRAAGSEGFLKELGEKLGRNLIPRPVGRPPRI